MLDALLNPVVFVFIIAIPIVAILIMVLLRRRQEKILPPIDFSTPIDYTKEPDQVPTTWVDRLKQAPLATKLVLVLGPLVTIVAIIVLALTFLRPSPTVTPTPVPDLPTITDVSAKVAGASKIVVIGNTTLPDGATVTGIMKENDQDFAWFNKERAVARAEKGEIRLTMEALKEAPAPSEDRIYTVMLVSTLPTGEVVNSEPVVLDVPGPYKNTFYRKAATPTPTPTLQPTAKPTVATQPAATAVVTPTGVPAGTLTATARNGGNIRRLPQITQDPADVLGQLNAGEVVTLLEQSLDGQWYKIKAPEAEGWVHQTLLTIPEDVASKVPVTKPGGGLTATVFNGGNVRDRPVTGKPLDQINAGETVQLLSKTADGGWFRITTIRNKTGWVHRSLLTIDPKVAEQVPVAS